MVAMAKKAFGFHRIPLTNVKSILEVVMHWRFCPQNVFFFFLCLLLLLLLFLLPFLPLLGCLLLCLSGLLPASLAWCLAFPCAWLGRPHLTSSCSCYCSCSCSCSSCSCCSLVLLVLVVLLLVVVVVLVIVLVIVLVLVLSSIVCGRRWLRRRRQWWWWSAFARLWCEVSICSLAWWWLAFVRLWFWRGWLVVAFARVWCPRVRSLGRWLASVCLGLVAAAGLAVVCHGYALSGLGSCLWLTPSLSF